jgi:hypothetical protein
MTDKLIDDIAILQEQYQGIDLINQLTAITSEHYDNRLLLDIYRNL